MFATSRTIQALLIIIALRFGTVALGQRYHLETQTPGGFLLLEGLGIINGTDVVACGTLEQEFRFGAICRMNSGVIQWSRKLRNSTPYYANVFHAGLAITGNSDILVVGQEVLYNFSCHVARLDQNGGLLWSTTVNVGPGQQDFTDVLEAPDGTIYAVGNVGNFTDADVVVAKFDAAGTPIWVRILDEPGEQYSRGLQYVNDTVHVLTSTATNAGDLALLAFTPAGMLVRSLSIGTAAIERPLAMTPDGAGGLLISFSRDYFDMLVTRVPSVPGATLPTWSIDTPLQLDLIGGLYFDPTTQECILLGNRMWMAYALRVSLSNASIVWERSFPDLYSFFNMTLTSDGSTMVASGGPAGFLPSGSYPAEFAQFDPLTGNDVVGVPCTPSTPSAVSISATVVPCVHVGRSLRTPPLEVYSGMEIQDLPLAAVHCGSVILPVELLSWTADKLDHAVRLSWSTGTERNSDRFIIERSADGSLWSAIGEVTAAGNNTALVHYAWDDLAPLAGLNYYRLRQVDTDGSETLSHVIAVDRSAVADRPLIHPNPAAPGELVTVSEPAVLMDIAGRVVAGPAGQFVAPQLPGVYVVRGRERRERLVVR